MEVKKLKDFKRAVRNFEESLKIDLSEFSPCIVDVLESGQVQKFEMCSELCWKTGKEFLLVVEGVDVASPKRVYKALFQLGYLTYEELEKCLDMVEDRNLLSHIYRREVVESVLPKFNSYLEIMKRILERFEKVL